MRRWAFLLSLLAALSGTPLRQAEAASDLARSLAELLQAADIESPDGGVGDDSGVGTLTASHGPAADVLGRDRPLFPAPSRFVGPHTGRRGRLAGTGLVAPSPARLRHAWLQVFRF